MKTKKSKSATSADSKVFSLGDLVSLLGLVLLAFCMYLGYAYGGENTGTSILYALLISLLVGLLLYAMIYAKKAENNFKKWKTAEYVMLAMYITVGLSTVPVMSVFINVNNDSKELTGIALQDLNRMEQAIADFKSTENANLSNTLTGLTNVLDSSNPYANSSPDLRKFVENEVTGGTDKYITKGKLDAYSVKWHGYIKNLHDRKRNRSYAGEWNKVLDETRVLVSSWKVLEVPAILQKIENMHKELSSSLPEISESYNFPVIDRSANSSVWTIVSEQQPYDTNIDIRLIEECKNKSSISVVGILLSAGIFLLILFDYFVTSRSTKTAVRPGAGSNDGGMTLKP